MGHGREGDGPPDVAELYGSIGRSMQLFYAAVPGAWGEVRDGGVLGCSALDAVFLNAGIVFAASADPEDEAERRGAATLTEFVGIMRGLGRGGYVCLGERMRPALEPLARDLGLEELEPIPLMWRPAVAPAEKAGPYPCELVSDEAGLSELLAISAAAYGIPAELYGRVVTPRLLRRPEVAMYLCRRDGVPVSCVYLVQEAGGVVSVAGMATLPERQGQGAGAALLAHVLRAHAASARAFCLTASAAGLRLYERAGFRVVDEASAWLVPPAA